MILPISTNQTSNFQQKITNIKTKQQYETTKILGITCVEMKEVSLQISKISFRKWKII